VCVDPDASGELASSVGLSQQRVGKAVEEEHRTVGPAFVDEQQSEPHSCSLPLGACAGRHADPLFAAAE
jgi:hypothetical protein